MNGSTGYRPNQPQQQQQPQLLQPLASQIPTGRTSTHYMYWDQEATRCLIRLRGERELEFDGNNGRKGQMWMEISDRMAQHGYDFGVEKVSKKWHNIMMTYNKNVKKKRDHGRVNWEYFQDLEVYYHGRNGYETPEIGEHHGLSDDSLDASELVVTEHATMANASGCEPTDAADEASPYSRESASNSPLLIRPMETQPQRSYEGSASSSSGKRSHSFIANNGEVKLEHQLPPKKPRAAKMSKAVALQLLLDAEAGNQDHQDDCGGDDIQTPSNNGGIGDTNSPWIRDYLQRKLELERERIKNQQDRHRDRMNFQKMTLMVQEKMEKSKVEALRSLIDVINRLT